LAIAADPEKEALARNQEQLQHNFDELLRQFNQLPGEMENEPRVLELLATAIVNNPKLMDVVGPMIDLYKASPGNHKDEVLRKLIELACSLNNDNCELRRQVEEFQRQNQEQQPTPSEEPTQVMPAPVTPPPDLGVYPPLPPPPVPVWDGTLDYIVDRREGFCPNAIVIARSVTIPCADGDVLRGDVYRTCRGNDVLLRNASPQYFVGYR
jgi:hypothetical protein